jgi:hypothetical protein
MNEAGIVNTQKPSIDYYETEKFYCRVVFIIGS